MRKNVVFISWQPYCSRSDHVARELGGESHKIYYDCFGSRYSTILFKYLLQTCRTLWILFKKRPKTVFVMSPPVFANMPVYGYAKLFKARYIIDAHTGAFVDAYWQKVQKLQKFLARKAELVIVTNDTLKEQVEKWGCRSAVIPDVPVLVHDVEEIKLQGTRNIVLINTFARDEPLDHFLEATCGYPDLSFYVTGKLSKASKYKNHKYKNVSFTDFLPDRHFYGLISAADLVIVLTTRDNTMQRGAYEAIYAGTPVITSDWAVLRENFPQGTLFVNNTVEGIAEGIQQAISNIEKLHMEAANLKEIKLQNWEQIKEKLLLIVQN